MLVAFDIQLMHHLIKVGINILVGKMPYRSNVSGANVGSTEINCDTKKNRLERLYL
jgi:hypothetical protein